jgi:hypothetical protein
VFRNQNQVLNVDECSNACYCVPKRLHTGGLILFFFLKNVDEFIN